MGFSDLLQQAVGALSNTGTQQPVEQSAGTTTIEQLAQGLSAAFRSDETPPFASMVGQLFSQSNRVQRAGMLNQLLALVGPAALSQVAGGVLRGILPTGSSIVTPDQTSQLTPSQVEEIAAHAEQAHPGVVDALAQFYAQHPALVKTLGAAAMSVAMAKFQEGQQS